MGPASAQDGIFNETFEAVPDPSQEPAREFGFREGSFVAAPILFEDPTVGTGLALGAGYLYQTDELSSTSYVGLAGFGTSNGSSGYGLAGAANFDENRWKLSFLGAEAEVFYDLFISSLRLPLRQEGTLARLTAAYGFTPQLSLGFGVQNLDTKIAVDGKGTIPQELLPAGKLEVFKFSLAGDWDRRNDSLFPTEGGLLSLDVARGESKELFDDGYNKAVLIYDHFFNIRASDVLAVRLAGCAVSDSAPFFDACLLGGTDAFRGFPSTEFIGEELASVQVAYRGRIGPRFGYEVFAGTGRVFNRLGFARDTAWRRAGGIGARFRLSRKFPFDYSVDVSLNDDGEQLLYVYVGQRF